MPVIRLILWKFVNPSQHRFPPPAFSLVAMNMFAICPIISICSAVSSTPPNTYLRDTLHLASGFHVHGKCTSMSDLAHWPVRVAHKIWTYCFFGIWIPLPVTDLDFHSVFLVSFSFFFLAMLFVGFFLATVTYGSGW